MATLALAAALTFPMLAHTSAELADWQSSWNERAEVGLTSELVAEWTDMYGRHLCQLGDICPKAAVRTARAVRPAGGVAVQPGVEQWRSLVAAFFPAETVDKALRVMWCESRGVWWADNEISTAAGLFQFLRDTWNREAVPLGYGDYDSGAVFDPAANIHAASVLSKVGSNWGPWSCGWA